MNHLLAAEGGYQEFTLGGAELFWLFFSAGTAILAIGVGFLLMRGVLGRGSGNAEDDRDRHRDPGGRTRVPATSVQDDRGHHRSRS